eukprot:1245258-Prymnesium_polylepis.1
MHPYPHGYGLCVIARLCPPIINWGRARLNTSDDSALQDGTADTATDTRGRHAWGRLITPPQHPRAG